MGYTFIKAFITGNTTGTPKTGTFTGGNTNGNTIVLITCERINTGTITGVTDTEGNVYTKVAAFVNTDGGLLNMTQSFWVAPVTGGSGSNNVVSVAYNGTNQMIIAGAEYKGIKLVSPFLGGKATVAGGQQPPYSFTPTSAPSVIVNCYEHIAGGANLSGLSGTDRTGVTNVVIEINDQAGVSGSNTVTLTSSQASGGLASVALALTAGANQLMMTGCGV